MHYLNSRVITSGASRRTLRHFHDNWSNDNYRKVVLNAMVWLAKADVPKNGIESAVSEADLDANLDPKPPRKPKKKK